MEGGEDAEDMRTSRPGVWTMVAVSLTLACTKVREQPVADPEPETAAVAPAPRAVAKSRPTLSGGPVTFASDEPAPSPSVGKLAPATSPAEAAAAPGTLNGDPKGLRRAELQRALDGALPGLASCFRGESPPGSVGLSFEADPSGKIRNVRVGGGGAEAERCVTSTLAGVRLPAFEGKPVPVDFPLAIQRGAVETSSEAPAQPPAAPKLFVNP